ncbi:hypothetical protein ID866_3409 [Astraeus odoratus]|nr:hypothetical protein ID866_3409 [Astraeus odoratus]
MYGFRPDFLSKYDHKTFPGAVPRTFIGSLVLGQLTAWVASVAVKLGLVQSKMDLQITRVSICSAPHYILRAYNEVVRLVLASLNSIGLVLMRHAVSKRFGRPTSWLYALLTLSQFHLLFWMSRTLPNMFALLPGTRMWNFVWDNLCNVYVTVNLAYFALYNRAPQSLRPTRKSVDIAVALLVFTAVVFRSEVALLLVPIALQLWIQGHTTLPKLIKVGLVTAVTSIALSVAIDSYFWDQWPLWPELYAFYFNVYLGKSAEWGIHPPYTYFGVFLPKLLLGALPLAALGAILDHRIRSLLLAPTLFVLGLSALRHKEWRFVVYIVPLVNIAAARGMRWLYVDVPAWDLRVDIFV